MCRLSGDSISVIMDAIDVMPVGILVDYGDCLRAESVLVVDVELRLVSVASVLRHMVAGKHEMGVEVPWQMIPSSSLIFSLKAYVIPSQGHLTTREEYPRFVTIINTDSSSTPLKGARPSRSRPSASVVPETEFQPFRWKMT